MFVLCLSLGITTCQTFLLAISLVFCETVYLASVMYSCCLIDFCLIFYYYFRDFSIDTGKVFSYNLKWENLHLILRSITDTDMPFRNTYEWLDFKIEVERIRWLMAKQQHIDEIPISYYNISESERNWLKVSRQGHFNCNPSDIYVFSRHNHINCVS